MNSSCKTFVSARELIIPFDDGIVNKDKPKPKPKPAPSAPSGSDSSSGSSSGGSSSSSGSGSSSSSGSGGGGSANGASSSAGGGGGVGGSGLGPDSAKAGPAGAAGRKGAFMFLGVAAVAGVAIATAFVPKRRVETPEHPLKGSLNRRINLFSHLASDPAATRRGEDGSYVNADEAMV